MSNTTTADNQQVRRAIELALLFYMLTDSDILALSSILFTGMTASMIAAYEQGLATAGGTGSFTPDATQLQDLETQATQAATSIADTYNADINTAIDAYMQEYEKQYGTLDSGAIGGAKDFLKEWGDSRAAWKSQQIAGYECGIASGMGTDALVNDVLDGTVTDNSDNLLDTSNLCVGVLPEDSSDDACAEWAGYMVKFEDSAEIPDFPQHYNCIHFTIVVNIDY